jgi:hypothetical protein
VREELKFKGRKFFIIFEKFYEGSLKELKSILLIT